jgi:class 3 adenylate cyclase
MPLFMDRHDLPGATPEDVAQAHVQDVEIEERYGVRYVTYWHEPADGYVFCLAEGPDRDSVDAVHRDSHGLVANKIIEVDPSLVRQFLGRIHEPAVGQPFVETAFRAVLFTDIEDSTSLTQHHGDQAAMAIVRAHDEMARELLGRHEGSEIKHTGDGIMASFTSVVRALEFATAMQRRVRDHGQSAAVPFRVRIGMSAGEPITENDDLFGSVVQMAARLTAVADPGGVCVSSAVRELAVGKGFDLEHRGMIELKGFDEPVSTFAVSWEQ